MWLNNIYDILLLLNSIKTRSTVYIIYYIYIYSRIIQCIIQLCIGILQQRRWGHLTVSTIFRVLFVCVCTCTIFYFSRDQWPLTSSSNTWPRNPSHCTGEPRAVVCRTAFECCKGVSGHIMNTIRASRSNYSVNTTTWTTGPDTKDVASVLLTVRIAPAEWDGVTFRRHRVFRQISQSVDISHPFSGVFLPRESLTVWRTPVYLSNIYICVYVYMCNRLCEMYTYIYILCIYINIHVVQAVVDQKAPLYTGVCVHFPPEGWWKRHWI